MKEWQRMCVAMKHCDECPMSGTTCWYGGRPDDSKSDLDYYEQQIMKWAEENPELVYPTFREWLISIGIIGQMSTHSVIADKLTMTHIPTDIAEKLGLKPKEGTC